MGPKKAASRSIPYGRQWITDADIKAVLKVLRSDMLTQGPEVERFEEALAGYCGAEYAVAVNSGTSALHLACLAAGLGSGDEAVTSPVTFAASANCVLYCGATPVFADIDGETVNIDPLQVKKKITGRTRAVIPVHFAGLPCDMEAIHKIAKGRGLTVIEDACHALGAKYRDSSGRWIKAGSCAHSDMAVLSFHPVKHITTGEGGAVLTNSAALYGKLKLLRSHGITKDGGSFRNTELAFDEDGKANPWYYEMQALGFNYRITDIQCALGGSQLERAGRFVERRREIAGIYNRAFKNIRHIKVPSEPAGYKSSYHLYAVRVGFDALGKSRSEVMAELKAVGIGTQVHYIPVHLQPYYCERFGFKAGDFPEAERYYSGTLSLPIYPKMTDRDVQKVKKNIMAVLG